MSVKKALVVDDSKLARITLKKKLELRAVDVDMVESASEALDYLQSHQPDIIFMDHLMPEIDGFEATRRIKANPATSHIPVIMCTGKEHEGYLQEATAIGATNILSKPPETEALDAILDMDLVPTLAPAAAAPVAEAPAFVEPPILQPISVPAAASTSLAAEAETADLIDDSFDADAAFGVETETAAVDEASDLIDTSELESLASLDAHADSSDTSSLLEDVDGIDSLDNEAALASLDDLLGDDDLLGESAADDVAAEPVAEETIAEEAAAEEFVADVAADESLDKAAFEAEPEQTDFAEPAFVAAVVAAPIEPARVAASAGDAGIAKEELLSIVHAEMANRVTALRETIIADLTLTIRRQLDDTRSVVGENAELHDSRLRTLEDTVADLVATTAPRTWVLEKLPPALDMARLTDDIAARIAIVQGPDVMQSDDVISIRARLDEVESELVMLRNREATAAPAIDGGALQSLLPNLSRQLDSLLQQRIPVIVSDISDQVQLQLAYQMNDGRAPATPSTPSLDSIITNQADVESQIAALKKQLNDEWNTRLQALGKQLKDQLQHGVPESFDAASLREQLRNDARDDIKRALSEVRPSSGGETPAEIPAADAGHFEQMLETVTTQFARTQADYEQKLKQSRLIAIGAVVVSVVVSAALAVFL